MHSIANHVKNPLIQSDLHEFMVEFGLIASNKFRSSQLDWHYLLVSGLHWTPYKQLERVNELTRDVREATQEQKSNYYLFLSLAEAILSGARWWMLAGDQRKYTYGYAPHYFLPCTTSAAPSSSSTGSLHYTHRDLPVQTRHQPSTSRYRRNHIPNHIRERASVTKWQRESSDFSFLSPDYQLFSVGPIIFILLHLTHLYRNTPSILIF